MFTSIKFGLTELWRDWFWGKHKKYSGGAASICNQIVEDRWNGHFFDVGDKHFKDQFWLRDIAICTPSLIQIGNKDRLKTTFEWALETYKRSGQITTTIDLQGNSFDLPCYGADTLPLFLFAIKTLKYYELAKKNKKFLNNEIDKYYSLVFDQTTKTVKPVFFSVPKDTIEVRGSCASAVFLVLLADLLREDFKFLKNPFKENDLKNPF